MLTGLLKVRYFYLFQAGHDRQIQHWGKVFHFFAIHQSWGFRNQFDCSKYSDITWFRFQSLQWQASWRSLPSCWTNKVWNLICILLYYLVVFHLLEKLRKFLDIFSILSRFKKWFQETFPFRGAEGPEKWKKFREITFWTKIIWNKWSNSFEISSTSVWKRSK